MTTPADIEPVTLELERAFLGAVIQHQHAEQVQQLLDRTTSSDFEAPVCVQTFECIHYLVQGMDQPPHPVLIYAEAEQRLDPQQLAGYGSWLIDTYRAAPPPATVWHLHDRLLTAAWRRAIRSYAERLLQASHNSPDDVLAEVYEIDADREHIDWLTDRREGRALAGGWHEICLAEGQEAA